MGFIDLTAINTYKREKNRLSYKLTEITVVKKHGWKKKKYIQQFYFLCVKICSPLSKLVKATQNKWLKKISLSSISKYKRQWRLTYLECIQQGTYNGQEGAKQVHQASNQIKRKRNFPQPIWSQLLLVINSLGVRTLLDRNFNITSLLTWRLSWTSDVRGLKNTPYFYHQPKYCENTSETKTDESMQQFATVTVRLL